MFNNRSIQSQRCILVYFGVIYLFLGFCIPSILSALTFPQDFSYSSRSEVLLDYGELWEINSIFHPFNSKQLNINKQNHLIQEANPWIRNYLEGYTSLASQIGDSMAEELSLLFLCNFKTSIQHGEARQSDKLAFQPSLWVDATYRSNYYARLYVRFSNDSVSMKHYSGKPRGISRFGLNTGEIDQGIIGYRNSWAQIELGRSREIWGPMVEDNLLLTGGTPAYERLMFQVQHRGFSYRWFYGYLEAIQDTGNTNIQRYIIGKAIEYRNLKNFVLGLGEVSILAGPNRPFDMAFLNPLSPHIEVDMNKRSNSDNISRNNAIWFLHFDWLIIPSLRLSGSLIIDEITLESDERKAGRADNIGWLGRVAWSPKANKDGLTFIGQAVKINTYTMKHIYRYCQFVTRDKLLGHSIGNDADRLSVGLRHTSDFPILFEIYYGRVRWGDNSLRLHPYEEFTNIDELPFPSGEVRSNRYLAVRIDSQPLKGFSVSLDGHMDMNHSGEDSALEVWTFSARYQIPFLTSSSSK